MFLGDFVFYIVIITKSLYMIKRNSTHAEFHCGLSKKIFHITSTTLYRIWLVDPNIWTVIGNAEVFSLVLTFFRPVQLNRSLHLNKKILLLRYLNAFISLLRSWVRSISALHHSKALLHSIHATNFIILLWQFFV